MYMSRRTCFSSVVTNSRPPSSSYLKITNRSFRYASLAFGINFLLHSVNLVRNHSSSRFFIHKFRHPVTCKFLRSVTLCCQRMFEALRRSCWLPAVGGTPSRGTTSKLCLTDGRQTVPTGTSAMTARTSASVDPELMSLIITTFTVHYTYYFHSKFKNYLSRNPSHYRLYLTHRTAFTDSGIRDC